VVNILDQKVRKLFSEHELERGGEYGFKVSSAECNTSGKRKAVEEEKSKGLKVFHNWRKAQKDLRELLADKRNLRGTVSKVSKVNSNLVEANKLLSAECEEMNVATLFTPSRRLHTPKAKQIVQKHKSIVATLESTQLELRQRVYQLEKELEKSRSKVTEGNTQVRRLRLKLRESRLKVEALNAEMSKLRQENKSDTSNLRKKNSTLLKIADDLNADARKKEEAEEDEKDLKVLNIMLAGVSQRQASAINKKYTSTYAHLMRQQLGPIQAVLNGSKIAAAESIVQLGTDESSISCYTTLCVSVMIKKIDGELEHLLLSASCLPRDKGHVSGVTAIELVFAEIKEKYTDFLFYCTQNKVDVSAWHDPQGISLKKLADASILMSDNAAAAVATMNLLLEHVRECVNADFTEEQLRNLSPQDRLALVHSLPVGCFAHLRALFAKEGAKLMDDYLASICDENLVIIIVTSTTVMKQVLVLVLLLIIVQVVEY